MCSRSPKLAGVVEAAGSVCTSQRSCTVTPRTFAEEPPASDAHRSRSCGQISSSQSSSRGQDDDASSVVLRCSIRAIDAVTALPLSRTQLRQQIEAKNCALKEAVAHNEEIEKQVWVASIHMIPRGSLSKRMRPSARSDTHSKE